MRKRLLAGAACILCFSGIAYGTQAYFTAEKMTHNIITSGNIRICLRQWDSMDRDRECPEEKVVGLMPGNTVPRVTEVENEGDNPAYIRVRAEKEIELGQGREGKVDSDLITLSLNLEDWTRGEDGYYYYNHPLMPGEVTEPLFYSVSFSPSMDNMYQGCTVRLKVTAYGVQSENNGESVFSALGWPRGGEEDEG